MSCVVVIYLEKDQSLKKLDNVKVGLRTHDVDFDEEYSAHYECHYIQVAETELTFTKDLLDRFLLSVNRIEFKR